MLLPRGTGRAMPEDLDDVAGPSFTGQHAIQKLTGAVDSREYANEDLAGKGSDGRETFCGYVTLRSNPQMFALNAIGTMR